jgi:phage shock protein A
MGLMKRFSDVMKAKTSKILDKAEDPRETLDYSYERQLEMVQKVRRGLADVATSRKRIELQSNQLQASSAKLGDQARQAVSAGREDLAREALNRRAGIESQLEGLGAQQQQLAGEEQKLTIALQRLQAKVEAFRTRKETIKATYTAAEATAKIGEAVSGISEEMGDVGLAIQRAEDKTAQLQARAGAVDELIASGALEDVTSEPGGDIQRQLDQLSAGASVDAELDRLKAELGSGPAPPKAIEAAGTPAAPPTQETAAGEAK